MKKKKYVKPITEIVPVIGKTAAMETDWSQNDDADAKQTAFDDEEDDDQVWNKQRNIWEE